MPMSSENLPPAGRFGSGIICLNCTLGAAMLETDERELLQAAGVPRSKQATARNLRLCMSLNLSCGNARRMGRHHQATCRAYTIPPSCQRNRGSAKLKYVALDEFRLFGAQVECYFGVPAGLGQS